MGYAAIVVYTQTTPYCSGLEEKLYTIQMKLHENNDKLNEIHTTVRTNGDKIHDHDTLSLNHLQYGTSDDIKQ